MNELNQNLRRSISLNVVGRYSNIVIQLGVTAVLARSLAPGDFGVMAAVSVLSVFLVFLSEMGLGPAIIQFTEINANQLAGLLWTTVIIGTLTGTLFSLCGPAISAYYHSAIYTGIARGMGINLALACWAIVPLALLRREQRFSAIAGLEVSAAVISGVAAIFAAYAGWGVYSLVVKSVLNAFAICIFGYALAKPPFWLRPSISGMRKLFAYSAYQFMFGIVNYFTRNLDKILIGRFFGASMLGLYDMSYRLMLMPVSNLTHVITPALQPVYAEHKNRPDIIFSSYRQLFRLLLVGGAFVGLLCVASSGEIIKIVYGAKWAAAVPIFSILSLSIAIQVVLSSTGSIFQSLGRTDLLFKTGLVSTVTTCAAIGVGVAAHDIELLCWLLVASFAVNAIQGFYVLVRKGFDRPVSDLLAGSGGFILGASLFFVLALAVSRWSPHPAIPLVGLIVKALLVLISLVGLTLANGDLAAVVKLLRRRTHRTCEKSDSELRPGCVDAPSESARQILVVADRFPVLSETFVIEQLHAFTLQGAQVTVLARSSGDGISTFGQKQIDCRVVLTRPHASSRAAQLWAAARFLVRGWHRPSKIRELRSAMRAVRHGLPGSALDIIALSNINFHFHADLIVAHFGHVGVSASYLQQAGIIEGRLATVFHGFDLTSAEVVEQYRPHYVDLFRSSEWLLPVSGFFADRLHRWGAYATQIHVCRMGIDAQRFAFQPKVRNTDNLKVLTVARLTEKKGVEYLVRALALLPASVTLTVIGTGPLDRQLRHLTDELVLSNRIRFVGARTHDEVHEFLSDADVFVLPSVTASNGDMEGIPVALMEAMATGVSVISTIHSGIPELIKNGETGLLVPERDHIQLAAALKMIASGEADVTSMRIRAREFVEAHFNVRIEAKRLFERVGIA